MKKGSARSGDQHCISMLNFPGSLTVNADSEMDTPETGHLGAQRNFVSWRIVSREKL